MALTKRAARDLLKDVEFPGDSDPTYRIAVSGKLERREVLLLGNQDSGIAAAVEIQRTWRGYRTRSKLHSILGWRHKKTGLSEFQHDEEVGMDKAFPHVAARYQQYLQWCVREGIPPHSTAVLSFKDYSARIIQSWWRKLARLGRWPRGGVVDGGRETHALEEQTAAYIIQSAWRRWNDVKVYRLYKDLISFRARGDPALMLKCINPAEAELLDKAAGVQVRFRLGGVNFPPNIYYKVFTNRPVVDLCAYSPRDYTAMAYKHRLPRDIHNKGPRDVEEDKEGWYRRWENNGWRLVSDRLFTGRFQDSITTETASQKKEFHHSTLQRREDVQRRRKQRKIEWLKQMYRDGTLQARQDLSEATTSAIISAADHLVDVTDSQGSEVVEEEDVDELLQWTNGLNYDEYIMDWCLSASSAFTNESPPSADEDSCGVVFSAR